MVAQSDKKRDKRIIIPVTEEEHNWVKTIAKGTYYKTTANFCREAVFQICNALEEAESEPNGIFELSTSPFDEVE